MLPLLFIKARIRSYVRRTGVFVREHEDSRQHALPLFFAPQRPYKLLAGGIATDLKRHGVAALVGRKVENAAQLGLMAQIYRDPRYETFRVFFTRGNEIVHATGVTSRLASGSAMAPASFMDGNQVEYIRQHMRRCGADGYFLSHNHPSGNPAPSWEDLQATKIIAKKLPGFRGHVVIDTGNYVVIDEYGDQRDYEVGKDLQPNAYVPAVEHSVLGHAVVGPESVARLTADFRRPGYITLLCRGTRSVRAILEVKPSFFDDPKRAKALIRRYARNSGAYEVFAVVDGDIAPEPLNRLNEDGFLRDVVNFKGVSMANPFRKQDVVWGKPESQHAREL